MHAEPTAYFLLRRASSWTRCAVMRLPEAPSGWPRAMAPPLVLVLSLLRPSSFSHARYCAANASLISTRSISEILSPALWRAPVMAATGPMPMILGSHPLTCHETRRARGLRPCCLMAASDAITMAPAPSLMPEALPAVTTPSFLKTGGSLPRDSRVVWGRACSSVLKSSGPFLPLSSIGAISALNRPSASALAHRCWLWSAYPSTSARLILYFSARFSAVIAMGSFTYESVRADHSVSSCLISWPRRVPKRTSRTAYGAWLMFSVPAARTTEASPARISWAPLITLWKPDPHRRFTVRAVEGMPTPLRSPTWRERYAASEEVCATLPTMTESTMSGRIFAEAKAALDASTARSVAVRCFSLPPNVPKAVRLAATMKIPARDAIFFSCSVSFEFLRIERGPHVLCVDT
eukprot:Opistho-2@43240